MSFVLFGFAPDVISALFSQLTVIFCLSVCSFQEENLQFSSRNVIMPDCCSRQTGLQVGWIPITAEEGHWGQLKLVPLCSRKMLHGWQQWHLYCISRCQNWCSFFSAFYGKIKVSQSVCFVLVFSIFLSQEEMFIPLPVHLQTSQAGNACMTNRLPIPSSKSEIQQITVSKWEGFFFPVEINALQIACWKEESTAAA